MLTEVTTRVCCCKEFQRYHHTFVFSLVLIYIFVIRFLVNVNKILGRMLITSEFIKSLLVNLHLLSFFAQSLFFEFDRIKIAEEL